MRTTYEILGMTCEHCARAVTGELAAVDGVTAVDVDVEAGTAVVTSTGELDRSRVQEAIEEAGYALAVPGRPSLL